ncbi:MAG: amidohydrolase family protein [Pseudomonadota bacterium]
MASDTGARVIQRLTLLFVIALTVAACQQGSESNLQSVDLVVVNANGYTIDDERLVSFDTLVINEGRVVAIGSAELAMQYQSEQTLDVAGKTLLPGLIDAHGHVSSLGKLRKTLDVAGVASLDGTLSRIAAFESTLDNESQWLLGRGWNQVLWEENRFPTRQDIDVVVKDRPVFLNRIDGHAAWANSKALELAGIDDDTPNPMGGVIVRDESGSATGVLVDSAMGIVNAVVPEPAESVQRDYLKTAMQELASLGITGVHDAGVTTLEVALYQDLADAGEMPIRVSAMLGGIPVLEDFNAPIRGYADDLFEVTSVKLYADGALGSRGAAMIDPYTDDPDNLGLLFADTQTMAGYISSAHKKGFAANIHAIGDAANKTVLDAFESVREKGETGFNDRIEHAQVVTLQDIPRFKSLDVVASFQPTHATSDMNMAEDRVGGDRILGAYAWQRMLGSGVKMAAGSDFPVEKPEMFDGLFAAVTRQDKNGKPNNGWFPDQALSREQTLAAFTIWASRSVGQGDRIGQLTPGMHADFIIIDRDYFEIPSEEIWQIKTLETWVGGRQVYAAE